MAEPRRGQEVREARQQPGTGEPVKSGFNEGTTKENSDLETDLRLAEQYGFDFIEFRLDKIEAFLRTGSLEELEKKLKGSRIRPHALNAIKGINLMSAAEAREVFSRLEWACGIGERLGSPSVVLVPTIREGLDIDGRREEIDRDCSGVLRKCSAIAAAHGMGVALEPIGLRDSAVRSLEQAWRIVQAVGADNVGLAVDTFNVHLFDSWKDIEVLRGIPVERIHVVHIADSEDAPLGRLDQRNRLWPGDGIVPIGRVISTLRDMGYDGVVSLELFRPEYWKMSPEEVIRIGSEKTRRMLEAG
ncbi:MAG: sugar phosphate isomerase/epimerase [Spirochaetia bacterium]|jgi:2-keto-myo-inositol isomerase